MFGYLFHGQIEYFLIALFVIIFSLTFHEFAHALSAKLLGDNTAERMGRLNLNPLNHIDPVGLIAVLAIGFGYAKPVPVTPRLIKPKWGSAAIAAAGPLMNLLIAIIASNLLFAGYHYDLGYLSSETAEQILSVFATFNLLLMLFNLLPIGPLDGHYIAEWLLPRPYKYKYHQLNGQYGMMVFMGLILLSFIGFPIFNFLWGAAYHLVPYLSVF